MNRLFLLFDRSKKSSFSRRILNFSLSRTIPFNSPHHVRVLEIYDDGLKVQLPYRRSNLNHLKGIHACALAMLAEFTAGTTLLNVLRSEDYRFILKDLSMTYHYQARMDISADCHLSKGRVDEEILLPLRNQDSVIIRMTVEIYDIAKNHICTGQTDWQIKKWDKVRSKL